MEFTSSVNGGVLGLHDGSPSRLTVPVNLAGLPALALPVGFSDGLPLGAQLIGSPLSDEQLLSLGMNYQAATDWHTRHPTGLPPASAPDGSELIQMRPAVDGLETVWAREAAARQRAAFAAGFDRPRPSYALGMDAQSMV